MEPFDWDIGPKSGRWTQEEVSRRLSQTPDQKEGAGARFPNEEEQLTLLALLLENPGLEKVLRVGTLEDWNAALAYLKQQRGATGTSVRI